MQVTQNQFLRVKADWEKIAGEPLKIRADDSLEPIYAFGSELACLRLRNKMNCGRCEYSKNMQTFFYANK